MLYDSGRAVLTKLCEKGGLNMSALLRKRIMKTTIPERPNIDRRHFAERINALSGSSTSDEELRVLLVLLLRNARERMEV